MFRLIRKDHSKGSRSEEKKKKILKSSKESAHTDVTSVDLREMEKGDVEQEGQRLFWDDQAKRKEKRKVMLKDLSKLQIKAGQGVVEAEQQEPIVCSRSMPATHNTPDNFCNQDFDLNLNSNQDGSESKVGNENSPNGSLNRLQGVSHALPSADSVCIHPSLSNTKTSETELATEQALISRDVLVDTPQVNQYNNPCRGPSQTGTDSCSVTDPELNHNNTSGGSQSGIHNNNSSNINTPSGHQQELNLAPETTPLFDEGTVNGPVQSDPGFIPSHASESVSGRSTEGTSLGDQATGTSVAGVSASSLANTFAQHRNMTTESSSKKPSTGYDFSNNVGKIDSPDGVPQEHVEYILDTSSYPSFPPTPAPKPESTNPPSTMQIVGPGFFQKEDAKKLTVDDQLIEKAVTDNTLFLEKLSKYLDRESRVIKCWKHLAFVLNVPAEETRKFDMYTEHSPTEDMFNYLTDIWNPDLKVKELKMKLRTIYRNDVIDSLIKGGYHDEMMLAALISGEPKFIAMLSSKLDKDSRTIGNWKSLATQFGIRKQMTEQFGLRGLGPTAALFEHMSTADGLKDLTMSELREHFVAMERKDLINILKRHKFEDSQLVRTVIIKGSELLTEIGERLNKEMRAVKNWRNLAYRLKIPHEEYDSFDTSKGAAKSPTKLLFEWLKRWKPDLTVKDLLDGLKQIDRYDVVDLVQQEVATAVEKNEADSRQSCSYLMQVDGATHQSTDLSVPSYPSQLPTTNQQIPVSTYAGHPPSATHQQTYGNQQSQGHHQSERYSKEMKESMKVRQLPLRIYSKICMKLNIRRDWSFDDFRMVAEELGMDRDTTEFIGQHRNPTDSLFVEYYYVTVLQLINILHKIERLDVAAVLEEWIKDVQ